MFKATYKNDKYQWTQHSLMKMKYYGLSQQRVKRVIKSPERIEEGIVEKTVACMQPTSTKIKDGKKFWSQEIWAMYQMPKLKAKVKKSEAPFGNEKLNNFLSNKKQIKIISAWKYPGMSPKQNPIPDEILDEIRNLL